MSSTDSDHNNDDLGPDSPLNENNDPEPESPLEEPGSEPGAPQDLSDDNHEEVAIPESSSTETEEDEAEATIDFSGSDRESPSRDYNEDEAAGASTRSRLERIRRGHATSSDRRRLARRYPGEDLATVAEQNYQSRIAEEGSDIGDSD